MSEATDLEIMSALNKIVGKLDEISDRLASISFYFREKSRLEFE